MKKGKVWLVGTGPGDIGLLTKKAIEVIGKADVIAYDALTGDEIMGILPQKARLVSVGKRFGRHSVSQEEINQMLLKEALSGKMVVRLKGGDPFIFGRGGEELELLASNEIPFEVVPGVTSAAAVPAYAGIPVTHRDFTSSFHVLTGHPRKDGEDRINYGALVQMDATLVFLMGMGKLDTIMVNLMKAGMDREMPAAVLENGTHACQRKVVSTVGNLGEEARKAGIQAPAVIIVGKVCSLSEKFSWYEKRKLSGQQIVVTRSRKKAGPLVDVLREEGAEVLEFPMIETQTLPPQEVRLEGLTRIEPGRELWITFVSPVGVTAFFELLSLKKMDMRQIMRTGAEVKFAAIGEATAGELQKYGWRADLIPEKYNGRELGKLLGHTAGKDARICLVHARKGSEEFIEEVERSGREWKNIAVYETICQRDNPLTDRIKEKLKRGEIRWVTFTSASTVRGFAQVMGEMDFGKVPALCIGEQTAREAGRYGMQITVSDKASIPGMIEKIKESGNGKR